MSSPLNTSRRPSRIGRFTPLVLAAGALGVILIVRECGDVDHQVVYQAKLPFTTEGLKGIPPRPNQSPRAGIVLWDEPAGRQAAQLLILQLPAGVRELPASFEPPTDPLETICPIATRYFAADDVVPLGVAIAESAKQSGLGSFGIEMRRPSGVVRFFISPFGRTVRVGEFTVEVVWSPRLQSPRPDGPEPYLVWIRFKQTCV
jgi:hypothetical protein